MLKKNIILVLTMLIIIAQAQAQVRPGIKAGFNLSNVFAEGVKTGDKKSYHMKPGFQFGMVVDWTLGNSLTLQPGMQFATQGFIDKYTSNGDYVRKFSLYYLQLPINVQYRLNLGEVDVLFQAGPYFGYGVAAKQKSFKNGTKEDISDSYKTIEFGNSTTDELYNQYDYGIGLGAGIEYANMQLLVGYNFGLYQMTLHKNVGQLYNIHMRNNGLTVTFAYIFGNRKTKTEK